MAFVALWASFADDWELNHRLVFDGLHRRIIVPRDVAEIDIKSDVYSAAKEWLALRDNAKYLPPLRTIGGDPLGGGKFAGDLYFLINGWKLIIDTGRTRVTGALFSDDYDTPFYDYDERPTYPATVSNLVQTVTSKENVVLGTPSSIAAAVWADMDRIKPSEVSEAVWDSVKAMTVARFLALR